ncbi:MAG: PHP domain-containing protein, partial [Candidatus Brocadiia bacterium]
EDSPTFVNGVLDRIYTMHRDNIIKPDPEGRADLHVHSNVSDGSVPPQELPALAAEAGLAAIALTDHDTVDGVQAAREAGEQAGVIVVAGVELTAYAPASDQEQEMEVHIAGLFVDADSEELNEALLGLREARVQRVREMVGKLDQMGIVVDGEEVLRRAENGAVGRGHLAQKLVEHGYCRNVREAFDKYLAEDSPAYVPKERLTPAEAIELVHAAGGVAVLCHPGLLESVEERVPALAEAGLDAIEVHYPSHSARDEALMMELARSHDLLITGGSDFHGSLKPDIHIGQEAVSLVELHKLQQRALSLA